MRLRDKFMLLTAMVCVSASGCSISQQREVRRRQREAVLESDLRIMREKIEQYTLEKKQAPQSLQDLVNGHYLAQIPTDPVTRKQDWVPYRRDAVATIDQTKSGIADVHSNSTEVGSNGIPYNTW